MSNLYQIVRFYQNSRIKRKVMAQYLTLEEAKEHCSKESTHGPGWFDGFERM